MAAGWTQDRVVQLAPDGASLKAGQGLALTKKWVSLGRDELYVWGECQGSGAKPYQVQFDLSESASKCSCPSRKFPCKHALGLMLILTASSDAIASQAMPAWVAGRIERTRKRQEKAEAPPKPVDEEAQAQRLEKRLARVAEGLTALKRWAEDLINAGIATLPSKGYAFFDEPARRLIDAQAPGVAGRVQKLAQIAGSGAGWQHPFVSQLASLYLLIRAFEGRAALPESVQHDVMANIGIPVKSEDIAALPAVRDLWQIIAQEVDVEEGLRVQRTWLFGSESRRPALVLAFAHGAAPLDVSLAPGLSFEGEVTYFPGNGLRAAVTARGDLKPLTAVHGLATLEELCAFATGHFSQEPWLSEVVTPVHRVIPMKSDGGWAMVDADRRAIPATMNDRAGWLSLAISGSHPIDLMTGYDGRSLRPLAIIANGEYVSLMSGGA
ncbi:MAG: zinc finger protein [Phycisphaerales bacterium]|nr:zinc finger protein [Phycisphaerales bacterium]